MKKTLARLFKPAAPRKGGSGIRAYGSLSNPRVASLRGLLTSPNTDLYQSLHKTRQLSRWMVENDSYASKYIELCSVYITGDDGIKAHPSLPGSTGKPLTKISQYIKDGWNRWGEVASLDGRFSFSELEQMAVQAVARDGEAFFRIIRGKQVNKYGFALMPIDPVLVDQEYNLTLPNGNHVIMGVERDRWGIPQAYWVWNRYLDDRNVALVRERERIPADEMIHIFDDATGVQVRGMPWTTPALDQMVRLLEWQDDYAANMKLAARTRLVLHNDLAEDELDDSGSDIVEEGNANRVARGFQATEFVNTTQSQIIEVDAGKRLEALNIPLPQSGVSESSKLILQRIASGLHLSYETLTSDGSKSSFSSVRHASIVERDIWRQRQKWFIRVFNKRVFREWIRQAVLSQAISLPEGRVASEVEVDFMTRGFSSIDAIKDVKGYVTAIAHGLTTRTQVVAEMGGDFQENLELLAREKAMAREAGIIFPEQQDEIEILGEFLSNVSQTA
jgi:lambda family phage portal protein